MRSFESTSTSTWPTLVVVRSNQAQSAARGCNHRKVTNVYHNPKELAKILSDYQGTVAATGSSRRTRYDLPSFRSRVDDSGSCKRFPKVGTFTRLQRQAGLSRRGEMLSETRFPRSAINIVKIRLYNADGASGERQQNSVAVSFRDNHVPTGVEVEAFSDDHILSTRLIC